MDRVSNDNRYTETETETETEIETIPIPKTEKETLEVRLEKEARARPFFPLKKEPRSDAGNLQACPTENSDGTVRRAVCQAPADAPCPISPSVFDVVDAWVGAAMKDGALSGHPVSGKWLRLKDAAFIAGVSPETVVNWCKRHGIGRQLHLKAPWKVDPIGLAIVMSGNADALAIYRAAKEDMQAAPNFPVIWNAE
ncbi:hypothetical protein [Mesorhizobium sp. 131-2-1]|uniref:hypothetical protein n=1 Tax=Mesorhizobium sp. 131-2-1 TaxID=2744518 RepID=UPI001928C8B4|nr:hypothetical protein [Mesorhizobium sp. 131-2-1]BCG91418.1 hypothetical protein MesoLj131a_02820 [Mesorhizobium sp. 131-2-1]